MTEPAKPRAIDFTHVEGPAPKRPTPPTPLNDKQAQRAAERAKRRERPDASFRFQKELADDARLKYEKQQERIRIQEEIAAGKRKPFFGRRKSDPNKPTMWWLDDKKGK